MGCPSCGSDDWKLARHVHNEGIQHIDTKSKGVGVGVGTGGVGIGVGVGSQKGVHQTELSKLAAPPSDPSVDRAVFGLFLSFFFAIVVVMNVDMPGIIGAGLLLVFPPVVGFLVLLIDIKNPSHAYNMARWASKKMCRRCGTFYD